jgi:O-antigen ligase
MAEFQDLTETERVPFSIFWLLIFIAGAISISMVPGLNNVVIGLGALAFFGFLFYSIRAGFLVTPEIKCFMVYFIIVTMGFFIVSNPLVFFLKYRTMVQIFLMTVMVMNFSRSTRSVKWILLAVFAGALIVGASAVWTGEYARSEFESERAAGLTMNANSFALNSIFATMICLYFFKTWKSRVMKIGLIGLVLIFGRLILSSGSRKGFIGFMATLFLWFIFSYASQIKERPVAFILGLVVVVSIGAAFYLASRESIVATRFEKDVKEDIRLQMYIFGFKLIFSNPILGVGLDHYNILSPFGTYSHSNYIEVFSNTGILGGVPYYLIYPILFFRLWRLSKYPLKKDERELVAFGKMYIILRCMLDFVVVSYFQKENWIFFAILIGWSYSMEKQLKANAEYQSEEDVSELEAYPADPQVQYMEI